MIFLVKARQVAIIPYADSIEREGFGEVVRVSEFFPHRAGEGKALPRERRKVR